MDTLQIKFGDTTVWGGPQLYHFNYDQAGEQASCNMSGSGIIILTRDSAGRVIRKDGDYLLGSINPLTSIYHYNLLGLIDTVTVGYIDSAGGMVLWRHDFLEHDLLGRLRIVRKPGGHPLHYYKYPNIDSFVYDGASKRCTDLFQFFYGNTTPSEHYKYTYDSAGRLASYARGNFFIRTFQRNTAGYITEITETQPGTSIVSKTYYYYDSLGATRVNGAPAIPAPSLNVYPNPAGDIITVYSSKSMSAYQLCSISGQVLQSGPLHGAEQTISIEALPQGAYLLKVQYRDGSRQTEQVMKT